MKVASKACSDTPAMRAKPSRLITRKILRKQARHMKKVKRQLHYRQQPAPGLPGSDPAQCPAKSCPPTEKTQEYPPSGCSAMLSPTSVTKVFDKKGRTPKDGKKPRLKQSRQTVKGGNENVTQREREIKQQRVKQLKLANQQEDKNIRKMEKQLRLNRRKSKTIPKSFINDGLDYLLDVCDSEGRTKVGQEDFDFTDTNTGFEEDLALCNNGSVGIHRKKSDRSLEPQKIENRPEASNSDSDYEEMEQDETGNDETESDLAEDETEDSVTDDADIQSSDESSATEGRSSAQQSTCSTAVTFDEVNSKGSCWEDIYGRLRDHQGNVISEKRATASNAYVPPGKRLASANDDVNQTRLNRQMKGLFNRLTEANLPSIVSSIEQLYLGHPRNSMQQGINNIVAGSLVTHVLSPERMIMEYCVVIAALHANVGTDVGAQFLELVTRKFDTLIGTEIEHPEEDKQLDNLILILSHLYNFGLVAATLLLDILNKLAERFNDKDIELILLVLRSVGFSLRKDDPVALKALILNLQSKAGRAADQPMRIRFMLDVLLAIRNNNMAKIPNCDHSQSEQLRKILRNNLLRKGVSLSKMNVSYDELLAADRRGRWWVVGSAWVGQGPTAALPGPRNSDDKDEMTFSNDLLEMARKQRMNTDVRRNIFCILLSAEDFIEACERLMKLNLKPQQEREIVHVAIDCCLQENKFNYYYAHVIQKFCFSHRRFQIATQFALWDRFKDLTVLSMWQIAHLAKLIVQLVTEGALSLAVLKAIQFTEMNRLLVRFLRQVMLGILLHASESVVQSVFLRINSTKLSMFKEGLSLFIQHFVLKNAEKMDSIDATKLKLRFGLVEQALNLGQS